MMCPIKCKVAVACIYGGPSALKVKYRQLVKAVEQPFEEASALQIVRGFSHLEIEWDTRIFPRSAVVDMFTRLLEGRDPTEN